MKILPANSISIRLFSRARKPWRGRGGRVGAVGEEAVAHGLQGAARREGVLVAAAQRLPHVARVELRGIVGRRGGGQHAAPAGRRRSRGDLVLDPPDHEVRAGLAVLVDRVLVLVEPLVDRPEVEVDLGVVAGQLQRLHEGRLGLLEAVQLEVDEAEIVEEGVGLRALRGELAVDLLRLLQFVLPEVHEAEEVQDALVARPQEIRFLELALGVLESPLVVVGLALVEVREEEPLIERGPGRGLAHARLS
jgi:hypothetical protein